MAILVATYQKKKNIKKIEQEIKTSLWTSTVLSFFFSYSTNEIQFL